ncbi:histidinol dehydrogenase [Legionella qingyii]|uniref:Histidinol dehydrogenase n=1 Tax=Legionella qingyii TaxID=2184757 RepID=A0A317U4A8_9GAMM|nr:histidinol dehydrogenase [Legionella qingyii]PWY55657.1 histidinol dehydrogenase [Legionella qingyii]RUR21844.1 histidinol dehydrogenase [Legionella qingyii]RUR25324.1 histidinol dehydrogenase [Legionella qingyii]
MLSIKNWQTLSQAEKKLYLTRPMQTSSVKSKVHEIIKQVRTFGDQALFAFTEQFDGACLKSLEISRNKIENAYISRQSLTAMNEAIKTITTYHQALLPENKNICTAKGVNIYSTYRPIQRVGLYVPGGNKTPLVSSLLMQAIPAQVAGCPTKILCTPPDASGSINEHLLVAARLCGIDTIYALGGAQAIAAMAYGTETVTKVDKIFGPGNSYVTEAKTLVASDPYGAAIDMPAGPSEVMILADNQANPAFVAADLLAQAEHGVDSQVILICDTIQFAEEVNQHLHAQFTRLSRAQIIKQSLANSLIIACADQTEQLNMVNIYAPEHLIINREDAKDLLDKIYSVGTVFLGSWAAETLGDYVTGSNHVLPTNGYAKNHNGLSTLDFLTRFNVQSISEEGIKNLGPAAIALAQIEGLDAHAQAVAIRLNSLEN